MWFVKSNYTLCSVNSVLLLPIALRPFQFDLGFIWLLNNIVFWGGVVSPMPTPSYPGGPMNFCRGCLP